MFNLRYIFAIIYLVLSSLLVHPNSLATEIDKSKSRIGFNQPISQKQQSDYVRAKSQKSSLKPLRRQELQINSQLVAPETDSEPPEKISKRWSVVGMFVTSVLFLFVLLVLFKKEDQQPKEKVSEPVIIDGQDRSNLRENATSSSAIIKAEEVVEEEIIPMIGMEMSEEFDYQPIKEEIASKSQVSPAFSSEINPDETWHPNQPGNEQTVDSDIMGRLTILTSNTTEIDVVFELIQDLQQQDRDLRRKAIWGLAQTNDFRGIEPLVKIMPQADSLEKGLILDAITQIASRNFQTINRVLLTSLEDESAEVRKRAVRDLTVLYKSMSFVTVCLSKMTEDSDREVQQTAKWALEQFNQMSLPFVSTEYGESSNQNPTYRNGKPSRY
ncbi:MAG: hypothetical protein QNJ72_05635 [Pleurocapsa sp. MO_226.B13]|nr:hypothetical protein [Pleurocapsa sp. MO_226.B13]